MHGNLRPDPTPRCEWGLTLLDDPRNRRSTFLDQNSAGRKPLAPVAGSIWAPRKPVSTATWMSPSESLTRERSI